MQELIDHLKEKAGLTAEQADKAIEAVKDFVKQKFPMLEGAIENMLGKKEGEQSSSGSSDILHKAEDMFDNVKDKVSGLFGDKK